MIRSHPSGDFVSGFYAEWLFERPVIERAIRSFQRTLLIPYMRERMVRFTVSDDREANSSGYSFSLILAVRFSD